MPWEIADRHHPDRPGPRYEQLARVAEELGKCQPAERFFVRWIGNDEQTGDRQHD